MPPGIPADKICPAAERDGPGRNRRGRQYTRRQSSPADPGSADRVNPDHPLASRTEQLIGARCRPQAYDSDRDSDSAATTPGQAPGLPEVGHYLDLSTPPLCAARLPVAVIIQPHRTGQSARHDRHVDRQPGPRPVGDPGQMSARRCLHTR